MDSTDETRKSDAADAEQSRNAAPHSAPPTEISPATLAARLAAGDAPFLLDCREAEELQWAQLDGAVHIPMGDIPTRLTDLDPDREIVVFCHLGVRSQAVAAFLRENDFADVKNLTGGIDAWSTAVDPRLPRY